jgi:hypothetical protein
MLEDILISLGICVALPVLIVWLTTRASIQRQSLRSQVLLEAIKAKADVNVEKIIASLSVSRKSAREIRNRRLLIGCCSTLCGIALLLVTVIMKNVCDADSFMTYILLGCILLAIGISFLIVYFVTKKQPDTTQPMGE